MKIDLAFTPFELEKKDLRGKAVAVIDALRATSTMIAAFENGCSGFIPVSTVEEAMQLAALKKDPDLLLGGERNAMPLEGFHLGNSPRDYRPEKVRGKIVVLTTTNGTQALLATRKAAEVFIGAFLNISALSRRLEETGRDVIIACSGEKGLFCLEDTVCAGAIINRLEQEGVSLSMKGCGPGRQSAVRVLRRRHLRDACRVRLGSISGKRRAGERLTDLRAGRFFQACPRLSGG